MKRKKMDDVGSFPLRKRKKMVYGNGGVSTMTMVDCHWRREKWVKHYSSSHKILLVGEGDFSFSLSLALGFGSAFNVCATSLDSYEALAKYGRARSNLDELWRLGATLLHRVDATRMKHYPQLNCHKFDRIVFNFPHAGFRFKEDNPLMIGMHKDLVRGFFSNARWLLQHDGEVHVSHKNSAPYSDWNLEELAHESGLQFLECVPFHREDYPHYQNKRGQGPDIDKPFNLGACSTFKFTIPPHSTYIINTFPNHLVSMRPFIPKEPCLFSPGHHPLSQLKFIVKGSVDQYAGKPMYTGALIDPQKTEIAFISGPLFEFPMDSNVAELLAIKHALLMFERSNLCGRASLVVESDSSFAVSWIKSRYGNPLDLEVQLHVQEITMALHRIGDVDICCSFGVIGVETHHQVVRGVEMWGFDLKHALVLWF